MWGGGMIAPSFGEAAAILEMYGANRRLYASAGVR